MQDYEGGYGAYSPGLGNEGYVPAVFRKYDNEGIPGSETGSTGNSYARKFCPVAQGFIVEGLKDGDILFKNSYRVFAKENSENSQFKIPENFTEDEFPFLRLQVEFDDLYVRELLLAFLPQATTEADRALDAKNLSPLESDAGWEIDHNFYVTAVNPSEFIETPLIISTGSETNIKFKLAHSQNILPNLYLYDSETEIYYDLKGQDVTLSLPEGEFSKRFWIRFGTGEKDDTIPQEPEIANPHIYQIFQNNSLNRTEIQSPANSSTEGIFLYDSSGRKVREITGLEDQNYYEISTENLSKGIYIIKILSAEGTVISKKVIISKN